MFVITGGLCEPMIDTLFLLAVGAVGWGLSLATYAFIARRTRWPMGSLHLDFPAIPALIGIVALAVGLYFALIQRDAHGGWVIVLFGVLLAIFWTGFLRVGSQISLVLAPLAALLLLICWLREPLLYQRADWTPASQPSAPYMVRMASALEGASGLDSN